MSPSKADFQVVLGQARELVRESLERTEQVIMHVAESAPAGISERLVSLFGRKGKRIRSTLLCLIANCGEKAPDLDRVAHACASVELLHLASLVHDDIIDGTELRRGKLTAHKEWGTQVAVLVGDYVLSQSMRCVIDEEARNIPVIISDAADMLIVGEIMELDHCGEMTLSRAMYNEIINRKTAALIEASLLVGAMLAKASEKDMEIIRNYGRSIGLAFQIVDDILDIVSTTEELGKDAGSDIEKGKATYPSIVGLEKSRERARELYEESIKALDGLTCDTSILRSIAAYIITRVK